MLSTLLQCCIVIVMQIKLVVVAVVVVVDQQGLTAESTIMLIAPQFGFSNVLFLQKRVVRRHPSACLKYCNISDLM